MAQQHTPAFKFDNLFVGPGCEPLAGCLSPPPASHPPKFPPHPRDCNPKKSPTDPPVSSGAISASPRLRVRSRLLFVIARHEQIEALADLGDNFITMPAAANRISSERFLLSPHPLGVGEAG